jgi:5-methylcytosine-specific restriction enzyme subunit McrC
MIELTKIPIKNLFHMYCYALNMIEFKTEIEKFSKDQIDSLETLLATIYLIQMRAIRKKGFYGEYVELNEDYKGVRGKINFTDSISHLMKRSGFLNCEFDEFSLNNLKNRFVKSVGIGFLNTKIQSKLKHEIRLELEALSDVEIIQLDENELRTLIKLEKDTNYIKMLNLCHLFLASFIPSTFSKEIDLTGYTQKRRLSKIYETFLRNFYKEKLSQTGSGFIVQPGEKQIKSSLTVHDYKDYLPNMSCDILIEGNEKIFILDAKFYKETFQRHEEYGSKKIHSHNLFQMESYITHFSALNNSSKIVSGILIYPTIDEDIWFKATTFNGSRIEAATVNLSLQWYEIEERLLNLIGF